jgi:hypothetical protein
MWVHQWKYDIAPVNTVFAPPGPPGSQGQTAFKCKRISRSLRGNVSLVNKTTGEGEKETEEA